MCLHKIPCCLAMELTVFLLVCTLTYTVTAQQGGCNSLSTKNGLINGTGKTGVIPNVQAPSGGTIILVTFECTCNFVTSIQC